MGTTRVRVLVQGRVQGVGFRYFTQRTAQTLDLAGWVRNRADGTVEAELEGDACAVEAALDSLRRGPAGAAVENMKIEKQPCSKNCQSFEIRL